MQALHYQAGFGNEFATEALPGALPVGQNSPQRAPYGLYAEQLSGTAFTAPRHVNRRSWLYRIRPAAMHQPFAPLPHASLLGGPFAAGETPPDQLRWNPAPMPPATMSVDFIDSLVTMAGNGDCAIQSGIAIHLYAANRSMTERFFYDADGELLIVPQQGRLHLHTECGVLHVAPGEIAVLPRGVRFRVVLADSAARGYVCENFGAPLRLPELGPSAPTAWPMRATSWPRSPASRTARATSCSPPGSAAGCGRQRSGIHRWMWWPGTVTTRPANTIWRASIPSTLSATTILIRRS